MKSHPELVVLALWAIAILATALVANRPNAFTFLAPLYFVCMAGSYLSVRRARHPGG